jgi:glucosamine-6-phosphate deaminase
VSSRLDGCLSENWVSLVRVVILDSAAEMARVASKESLERCGLLANRHEKRLGRVVLGLATGGTPVGLYRQWIEYFRSGDISFQSVTTFNLDEYVGLPTSDPRSYHAYMREHLFDHIDIALENTHLPDGCADDLNEAAANYEWQIEEAGGIDYQILGIGSDGHIGFNEIGSSLASRTRVKTLTRQTRIDNARYFDSLDQVPTMAITMGIGTIMSARSILLIASGESKARAIRDAIEGPVTSMVPASVLQLHPDVTIMIDEDASRLLAHCDYYRESEANRIRLRGVSVGIMQNRDLM